MDTLAIVYRLFKPTCYFCTEPISKEDLIRMSLPSGGYACVHRTCYGTAAELGNIEFEKELKSKQPGFLELVVVNQIEQSPGSI